jgi:hypothetical protein
VQGAIAQNNGIVVTGIGGTGTGIGGAGMGGTGTGGGSGLGAGGRVRSIAARALNCAASATKPYFSNSAAMRSKSSGLTFGLESS